MANRNLNADELKRATSEAATKRADADRYDAKMKTKWKKFQEVFAEYKEAAGL